MNIIIDVREKKELNEKYLESYDSNKIVLHVATSQIEKYIDQITSISQTKGSVYLVCRSGSRALTIKERYFRHVNNINYLGTIEDAAKLFNIKLIKNFKTNN